MIRQFTGRFYLCVRLGFFLFSLGTISTHSIAQCSVTSVKSGSTFSNNASIGSFSWSSIGNILSSDNVRASNGVLLGILATQNTHYIVMQNFGFGVPAGAAICGIEVTIERRATGLLIGSSIRDNSIRLIKNNVITGSNLAAGGNWPGSDGSHIYGSISETWGSTWDADDINAANFGIAISARLSAGLASLFLTAQIDQVSVRVFYNLVLPVQLVNFKALQQEDKVNLEWATASENNNSYFIIERSANGVAEWQAIDSVIGSTKSDALRYYHTTDNNPLFINFYRLKQIDSDGHTTFSKIVKVQVEKIKKDLRIFPNPIRSNNEITALFAGKINRVLIKSIIGKEILINDYTILTEGMKLKLPDLQNGYYWIVIQTEQNIYTKKILVLSN